MKNNALEKIPECIGIIMDGNRRWAKERDISDAEGHIAGYEKLKEVIRWSGDLGIKYLIVYAFAKKNWERSDKEVGGLMDLFKFALSEGLEDLKKEEIRISFIGEREDFGKDIQKIMVSTENDTREYTRLHLVLAMSYSGKAEIIYAAKQLFFQYAQFPEKIREITESNLDAHMYTRKLCIPPPDLVIRTSGEQRLSDFLPWQSIDSELFFPEEYWPDFTKEVFWGILKDFSMRERRFGK